MVARARWSAVPSGSSSSSSRRKQRDPCSECRNRNRVCLDVHHNHTINLTHYFRFAMVPSQSATTIDALQARVGVLQDIEAMRVHADAATQETNALAYESAQFLVDDLWHMAAAPRQKVLAVRERVFGTGRRLPQGVRGAHGRFNRVQWMLDGSTRLVDMHGRTESEAEEDIGLPWVQPEDDEDDEDGSPDDVHRASDTYGEYVMTIHGLSYTAKGSAWKSYVPPLYFGRPLLIAA